jgi:hypothetical protein
MNCQLQLGTGLAICGLKTDVTVRVEGSWAKDTERLEANTRQLRERIQASTNSPLSPSAVSFPWAATVSLSPLVQASALAMPPMLMNSSQKAIKTGMMVDLKRIGTCLYQILKLFSIEKQDNFLNLTGSQQIW